MSEPRAIDPIADVLDALLEDRNKLLAEKQKQAAILDDLCDWAQHIAASEDDRIHSIVERAQAVLAGTPSEDPPIEDLPDPSHDDVRGRAPSFNLFRKRSEDT
jgi:hypothetical protein